jgi:hypothetical protein
LAAVVFVVGVVVSVETLRRNGGPPGGDPRKFFAIPLGDIVVFGALVSAAVVQRQRSEAHKRLMMLATISLLRAIVERRHRAFGHGPFDAALHGLMMQSARPTDRKIRRVFPIGQQYPRPLDPARRFRSRLRYRSQLRCIRIPERQFNRPPPRCHDPFSCGHTRHM